MKVFSVPKLLALTYAVLLAPCVARAELGGGIATVAADSGRMAARMTSVPMGAYARHDLMRVNGGVVHELTDSGGRVFAVTWAGPGKPDLRAVLGRYFPTFQATSGGIGRTMHALRRSPRPGDPDLQIHSEGHMGWFRGVAYIPSLAPPGFSPNDLPQER